MKNIILCYKKVLKGEKYIKSSYKNCYHSYVQKSESIMILCPNTKCNILMEKIEVNINDTQYKQELKAEHLVFYNLRKFIENSRTKMEKL